MGDRWVKTDDDEREDERLMRSREVRVVACSRCNAPAGFPCTNLAEGPYWKAGWNHEARRDAYHARAMREVTNGPSA